MRIRYCEGLSAVMNFRFEVISGRELQPVVHFGLAPDWEKRHIHPTSIGLVRGWHGLRASRVTRSTITNVRSGPVAFCLTVGAIVAMSPNAEAEARSALRKARLFLAQAKSRECEPNITTDRLPFTGNLEAAMIYGRSVLDHMRTEFSSKPGYRAWHDVQWQELEADPLFKWMTETRNFAVHQGPLHATATTSVHMKMVARSSVTISADVIRADGTIERDVIARSPAPARSAEKQGNSRDNVSFYFNDQNWRAKPAVDYVDDYLALIEQVLSEAEKRYMNWAGC